MMARQALDRIDGHEKSCADRWEQARKSMDELHRRWWWLLTTIIGALVTGGFGFFALWNENQKTLTTIQITLETLRRAVGDS